MWVAAPFAVLVFMYLMSGFIIRGYAARLLGEHGETARPLLFRRTRRYDLSAGFSPPQELAFGSTALRFLFLGGRIFLPSCWLFIAWY